MKTRDRGEKGKEEGVDGGRERCFSPLSLSV